MGTWESGTLEVGTRCFDLLCTGKCNLAETNLKLNVESVDKIPNFFTKNSEGKIIFSNPSPMSVITTPKGHGTWIRIELKTINGVNVNSLSGIAKHMCLGIKKRSENNYVDVIHAEKLTSEYIDLFDTDAVELVPLLSKTEVASNGYELVKTGDEIVPSDFGVTGNSFDFGSVYRVNVKDEGAWITRETNLRTLDTEWWISYGSLGIGPISGQEGDQLVATTSDGALACSSDGIYWLKIREAVQNSNWGAAPKYGNGVWCSTVDYVMHRSTDGGKTWENAGKRGARNLAFGNNIFMFNEYCSDGGTYASTDAKTWTKVETAPDYRILVYGNGKWICGGNKVYQSKDGRKWEYIGQISSNESDVFNGGCYANGYFYVLKLGSPSSVMRSPTGEKWEEVSKTPLAGYNITYYKNKLYLIEQAGSTICIGIPN